MIGAPSRNKLPAQLDSGVRSGTKTQHWMAGKPVHDSDFSDCRRQWTFLFSQKQTGCRSVKVVEAAHRVQTWSGAGAFRTRANPSLSRLLSRSPSGARTTPQCVRERPNVQVPFPSCLVRQDRRRAPQQQRLPRQQRYNRRAKTTEHRATSTAHTAIGAVADGARYDSAKLARPAAPLACLGAQHWQRHCECVRRRPTSSGLPRQRVLIPAGGHLQLHDGCTANNTPRSA